MNRKPTEEQLNAISAHFKRHESVENYVGEKPRRLSYARAEEPVIAEGLLTPGSKLTETISVHWDDPTNIVNFEIDQNGDWTFTARKIIAEYFSISVSLTSDEIERLNSNTLLVFGSAKVNKNQTRAIDSDIFGKMTFIRGNTSANYDGAAKLLMGKKLVGFSLDDPSINFSEMYRIWVDFIIGAPNCKKIIIGRPELYMQERILF